MWISYAQNFEDVMLERAFANLAEGFYVDVGAWDPDLESVTRHFYERGWRGVNIEPNPYYFRRLQARRPRDVNLSVAVGARGGQATMTLVHHTGMSSLDVNVAALHAPLGFEQKEMQVEVRTLNSVFEEQAPSTVHFLKIDCEGSERDVIVAFDLGRFRPWIILVEFVAPGAPGQSHTVRGSRMFCVPVMCLPISMDSTAFISPANTPTCNSILLFRPTCSMISTSTE